MNKKVLVTKNSAVETVKQSSSGFEPRYESGKAVCGLIVIIGWVTVGIGFYLAYAVLIRQAESTYGEIDYLTIIPQLFLILGGFMNVALGQVGRAIIDNTNANLERLALMKLQSKKESDPAVFS